MYKRAGNDLDNSKRALSREIDSFTTHIPGYVERVRELQDSIRSDKRILFIAPEIGAILGFCSVWAVYAMMRWISLGFCKYKEKDGQKANNR